MKIDPSKLSLAFISEMTDNLSSISLSQLGEDLFINRFFEKQSGGFYLDVGCFDPRRYSNTYLLRKYRGWKGVHIDANPQVIDIFKKTLPDFLNINAAIDEIEQDVELVVYKGAAHSTIDETRKKYNNNIDVRTTVRMKSKRLERLIEENLPPNQKIDFVNIDVEGKDLAAVKSINLDRFRPKLICIEDHEFVNSTNGGQKSAIMAYMFSKNYAFASHYSVSSFYISK